MKKYVPPYPFVEVIWDDAASNSEAWVHKDDIAAPEQVITRGWLIKEDERSIAVASSVSNIEEFEDTVGNTMTIPKGMIVSRRNIKVANARSKSRHNVHPKSGTEEVHREPRKG
jgi:hypothetical protein